MRAKYADAMRIFLIQYFNSVFFTFFYAYECGSIVITRYIFYEDI